MLHAYCPKCQSGQLAIVGCFVYSETGVPLKEDFSFLDFKDHPQAFASQKLILCHSCKAHFPLKEAEKLSYLEKAVFWEKAVNGRKQPVICPLCHNTEFFVKENLVLVEQTQNVRVDTQETVDTLDVVSTHPREDITLKYRCANEGCPGVITVNEDTFRVTPL